ncbi:hypothetical protein HK104_001249 [Borealophlyctis nickersoniae]|nr:hypothetical protein HK104_001249 [Borealophlyctis nickersoniae]
MATDSIPVSVPVAPGASLTPPPAAPGENGAIGLPPTTGSGTTSPKGSPASERKKWGNGKGDAADHKAAQVANQIRSLLLWTNPIASAATLVSLLTTIYIFTHYSPIRIITLILSVAIAVNFAIVNLWVVTALMFTPANDGVKKPPTMWFLDRANRNIVSHNAVHQYTDLIVDLVNVSFGWLASILAIDNNSVSFEVLIGTLAVYWLSGVMSGMTLLTTLTILAFVAPPVYMANKGLIDKEVGQAQRIASTQLAGVQVKLHGLIDQFKAKTKGVAKKAQ